MSISPSVPRQQQLTPFALRGRAMQQWIKSVLRKHNHRKFNVQYLARLRAHVHHLVAKGSPNVAGVRSGLFRNGSLSGNVTSPCAVFGVQPSPNLSYPRRITRPCGAVTWLKCPRVAVVYAHWTKRSFCRSLRCKTGQLFPDLADSCLRTCPTQGRISM